MLSNTSSPALINITPDAMVAAPPAGRGIDDGARGDARPSMPTTTGFGEPVPRPRAPILGGKPGRHGGRLRMPQRHA
jgi:hypothetical protein